MREDIQNLPVLGEEELNPMTQSPDENDRVVADFFNPKKLIREIDEDNPARRELGSIFEPYGGVKRIDKRLGLEDLGDIPEARAQAQTGIEKLSMILPRINAKILSEVAKIPGELGGLAMWAADGFDIAKFEENVNNAWVKAIDEKAQEFNDEILPVYKRRAIEEGGFFKQITSPEFWATEGADGIGFLASMMTPGIALRALGLGSKVMKLATLGAKGSKFGKAGKLSRLGLKAGDNINDWASAGVNTLVEAVAEGTETMNSLKQSLQQKRYEDLIKAGHTEEEAEAMSNEYIESDEVKRSLGKAGFGTFSKNLPILMASNVLDQKWLFRGFRQGEAAGVIGRRTADAIGKTGDDVLSNINRLTPKQLWGKAGKTVGTGILKEGFWEEGMQFSASELEKQKVLNPDKATNILETYAESLSDTDMQKSIFLGAMLGGVMGGIGGYRSDKREDEYLFGEEEKKYSKFRKLLGAQDRPGRKGVINVFKDNFVKRYQSVGDLYEKNENGDPILDENNQPKIDEAKLAEYGNSIILDEIEREQLNDLIEQGDREGFEYIKNIRDFKYMAPFIKEEGGYELLKEHINKLAKSEFEELQKTGLYDNMSIEEIKKDLLAKADKINNIYKKGESNMVDLFEVDKNTKKYARDFSEKMFDQYLSSEYTIQSNNERIRTLSKIASEVASQGYQTKPVTADKLVPGHMIRINGEVKQVIQSKDNVLRTIGLDSKQESKELKESDVLELITNISPVDRKRLFDSLFHVEGYAKQIDNVRNNQEKLFSKEGQQKAFDEYVSSFEKIKKETKDIPKQEKKDKIDEAETTEDLDGLKEEVKESDLSEKEKKDLEEEIRQKQAQIDQLAAQMQKNKTFKSKNEDEQADELANKINLGFDKTDPIDSVVDSLTKKNIFSKSTVDQLTQDSEDTYETDRHQDDKNLDESEDKLAESEFKTTYVNLAYLAIKYDEGGTYIKTRLDKFGNIVFGAPEHSIPSIPEAYAPGTKLIMYIDSSQATAEDTIDTIPIAIQTIEDYEAKKQPYLFVHRMDWITDKRVAKKNIEEVKEQTKALRKLIFDTKVPQVTFVMSKTNGWLNRPPKGTKNPKQYSIRDVIKDDTRPVLGMGSRDNTLWTDGSINVLNGYQTLSGIPYLVLPTANGENFAVWLKQEAIKNNPNFEKYNKTVVAIIEEYVNNPESIKSIQDLRAEVGKYYHVNTDKLTDELLKNENKQLIFHIQEDKFHGIKVVLVRRDGDKDVLYDYFYKKGKWIAKKGNKVINISDMAEELGNRIPNKYPNITKEGIIAGKNFTVYELVNDKLTKVKKDYIDFLSENRVVTTSIQPNMVNNTRTYFSQPNIAISANLNLIKPYESKKEKKEEEDIDSIELLRRTIFNALVKEADKHEVKDDPTYDDMQRDLEWIGTIIPVNEFLATHNKVLRNLFTEEELKSFEEVDDLIVDSEKIAKFDELLKQLTETTFTEKQEEEGKRIEEYCKGVTGKGSKISR